MGLDTYSMNDKQARCSECGNFMPWGRSRQIQKSDGMPLPSPILLEVGLCARCEAAESEILAYINGPNG